jgi:pimeloyl-ACP methyl ester carboxylesterase
VGEGVPVVLVHGWALGERSFRVAAAHLAELGCRVLVPALPGFGQTAGLPARSFSLQGYGEWLRRLLDGLDVTEPVVLVGHSFGGAVAITFAHDHPGRTRHLVLVNSVGGASGADRRLFDWAVGFPAELLPLAGFGRFLPTVLADAVPNLVRNPAGAARVALLARRADLTAELAGLARRGEPVTVIYGAQDRIVPRAASEALCQALGVEGLEVRGNHSWLIAHPRAFADAVAEAAGLR